MKNINLQSHKYDVQVNTDARINGDTAFILFAEECEVAVGIATTDSCGGGFDCAGTVGSWGSVGGSFGTFGSFGCCC